MPGIRPLSSSLTQHLSPILSSSRYRALLWSPPVACEWDKKKCLVAPSGSATSTTAFEACWGLLLLLWLLSESCALCCGS